MYAEIIVDVNNHNVNQSFYYIIPKEFENEDRIREEAIKKYIEK